jgi:signal transduction histidine kinase/FixJ family two-component response regulator
VIGDEPIKPDARRTENSKDLTRLRDAFAAIAQASTGFGLLLVATLWSFVYFHIEEQQRLTRAGAERTLSNLTRAYAEHVSRSVKEIDAALILLRRAMLAQGPAFRLADYTGSDYFKKDLILQIARVDARGVMIESNLGDPGQTLDLSDREHIRVHLERPDDSLYIGAPLVGRVSGRWSIQFTRKVLDAAGGAAGVLVASVNPESFSSFYGSMQLDGGAITLLGADGLIRARGGPDAQDQLSRKVAYLDMVRRAAPGAGCFIAASARDGVEKMICAGQVSGADLYVAVSTPLAQIDDDVANMRRQLTLMALALTLFCIPLIAAASWRRYKLARAMRQLAQARRKIAHAARDLTCALENMSDGIMLLDHQGAVLVSNDQSFALLGIDAPRGDAPHTNDEIRARVAQIEIAARGDDLDDFAELADLAEALRLDLADRSALCAGPAGRVLDLRTKRLEDGGFVRTIADVTRKHRDSIMVAKARDEAQAASRARSAFLARMSHEIRTPLHSVLGFSRLLVQEPMPAGARKIADMIHESSAHLISIVDDILDFSSVEAGRLNVSLGPVEIAALARRLESIARPLAAQKGLALTLSIAPQTPDWVTTDQRRLLQILTNLLSNAIKFTDQGAVVLRIAPGEDADQLRFSVEDTGCGIDSASAASLFEAFSRGERAADKPGSGLGLAIVKELVALMGGRIEAKGAPGAGATFVVTIPAAGVDARMPARRAPGRQTPAFLNVLVADDTRASLLLIRLMLEKRHCRVTCVEDGEAAVAAARAQAFDLILLDIQMPKMNGFEAAAAIRAEGETQAGARRPLVSALTAQVLPEDQTRGREAGMDHMLRKPFEDSELDALLARAVRERDERDARRDLDARASA